MTEGAREAQRAYHKAYREAHKDEINARHRRWTAEHKDRKRSMNEAFWEKKATETAKSQG